MKKRVAVLAAVCMGVVVGVSVGVLAAEGQDDYLKQVTEANRLEILQEKYGVIAVRSQYYYEDGTVQSQYACRDADRYLFELEGNVTVDEGGDVYGFYEAEKVPYRMLFTDGAYEDYRQAETLTNWETMCELAQAGMVTFEEGDAEQIFWQEAGIDYAENGFDIKAEDRIGNVFAVDDETKEITEFRRILSKSDGTEIILQDGEILTDAEAIEPDSELTGQIFSDDGRKVTLIADAGTAEEKTYVQTVGKGCMVQFCLGAEYDGQVYEDAECTLPYYDGDGDRTSDVTVYARRMDMEADADIYEDTAF